jgi:transposase-like protein
MNENLEKDKI